MKHRIESEQLNLIFIKWAKVHTKITDTDRNLYLNHIDRINLRYGPGKEFDDYLWAHGGRITRENRRRYAEFFEDSDLTMFMLKWA